MTVWLPKGKTVSPEDVVLRFDLPEGTATGDGSAEGPSLDDLFLAARMCAKR